VGSAFLDSLRYQNSSHNEAIYVSLIRILHNVPTCSNLLAFCMHSHLLDLYIVVISRCYIEKPSKNSFQTKILLQLIQKLIHTLLSDNLRPAVPKLFGCWAKFATLSVSADCFVHWKKIHTHNLRHVCTLQFFSVFGNVFAMWLPRASVVAW